MVFLFVFFGIYAAMHSYVFCKVYAALAGLGHWRILLAAFFLVMLLAPLFIRLLDSGGYHRSANALGLVGYPWMAVVFWFLLLFLAADIWNLSVRVVALGAPAAQRALLPGRPAFVVFAGLIAVGLCWGLLAASNIQLRKISVAAAHLPPGRDSLRVVHISDLHLGIHTGERRLRRIVRLIKEADPDILVSTGDLVDSPFETAKPLADLLRSVQPPLGKFAVLGNHEFYTGLDDSLAFHEAAGFRVLRGQATAVTKGLHIAGVDDPAGRRRGIPCFTDEDAVLPPKNAAATTILLKHQPTVARGSLGRFDLQLSGHTHGGQIFPFHFVLRWIYGRSPGLHELDEGSALYLTRGSGTWGPPLRVLAPPEVTLITLMPANRASP